MHLALIGMSGIGKSYWSRRLTEIGYTYYGCDDLIATQLQAELNNSGDSLTEMANWMGFPYQSHYEPRARQYLHCEIEVMQAAVNQLKQAKADEKLVIDTTGSVIYVDPDILTELRQYATIVYLAITPKVHDNMLQRFFALPRPIIWQDQFQQLPHETPEAAIKRCYPNLLTYREQRYQECSDIVLPYAIHQQFELTAPQFLELIWPPAKIES